VFIEDNRHRWFWSQRFSANPLSNDVCNTIAQDGTERSKVSAVHGAYYPGCLHVSETE